MRNALPSLVILAGMAHAATLRGTVIENAGGHPLAHVSLLMEPIPGSGGKRMTGRTNRYGAFEFAGATPGIYIVQAVRAPFVTAYYGQKRWNGAGKPLILTDAESPYITIKMMRFAALGGTVVDENDVGQPGFPVAAYKNTRPLELAAQAVANDRGVFRIYGLLPGEYVVRSLGKELEGTGYKPTFAHETEMVDEARQVDLDIEEEARDVKLRALPGQLFTLTVSARTLQPYNAPVTMTFVSEYGRQVIQSSEHTFSGLPRGDYEIFAEAPSDVPGVKQGAYTRVAVGRNQSVQLVLQRVNPVRFEFRGLPPKTGDGEIQLLGRRKDLAGAHDVQTIHLQNGLATLTVGPWEFAVPPIEGYYVSGFSGLSYSAANQKAKRFDGWNETAINNWGGTISFRFSTGPGAVHGVITDSGDPVVGAPVFLEPTDLEPERRITETYVTLSDVHGVYRFGGLAPGHYRVLSSFEYQMADSKIMTEAHAKELQLDAHADFTQDLDLYVIR